MLSTDDILEIDKKNPNYLQQNNTVIKIVRLLTARRVADYSYVPFF